MLVELPDPISMFIYCYGFFAEPVSWMLLDWIKPGQTVLDVGAHVGYFTRLAARLVGSGGRVHSFEPTPDTFRVLASNVGGLAWVIANKQAVHASEALAELTDYGAPFGAWNTLGSGRLRVRIGSAKPRRIRVAGVSLDAYCLAHHLRPDFIKIDVEGAESLVIQGAQETITTDRPIIAMEVGEERYLAPVETLTRLDYRIWVYDASGAGRHANDPRGAVLANNDILLVPREREDAFER